MRKAFANRDQAERKALASEFRRYARLIESITQKQYPMTTSISATPINTFAVLLSRKLRPSDAMSPPSW